jgi:hypothetical protein
MSISIEKGNIDKVIQLITFMVIAIFLSFLFLEVIFVIDRSSWSDLQAASPDEALMFECLKNGVWSFLSGYGPVFWATLDFFQYISPTNYEIEIIRILFILLKYLAFFILAWIILKQYKSYYISNLILLLTIITPGYMFFGKVISPEYLLLFEVSISIGLLILDDAKIGKLYYFALIVSILSVLTKISLLPYLSATLFYGLLMIYLTQDISKIDKFKKLGFIVFIVISIFAFVGYMTGIEKSISQIQEILGIVPKTSISFSNFLMAWERDNVTWDQIVVAGIKQDFLPIFFIMLLSLILIIVRIIRGKFNSIFALILFLVATGMFLLQIFQSLAFGWYLFVPVLMYIVVIAMLLNQSTLLVKCFVAITLIVYSFLYGIERVIYHINVKKDNNRQLKENTLSMNGVVKKLDELKCIKTGNVDILVPLISYDQKNPRINPVLPLRISLNNQATKKWEEPDFLIINKNLHNSPLLQFVIKEKISDYEKIETMDNLDLLIKKEKINCE